MVDARGYVCPMPVLLTQKALKDGPEKLEVMVDNNAAKENVTRFAQNSGYTVAVEEKDGDYCLTLTK